MKITIVTFPGSYFSSRFHVREAGGGGGGGGGGRRGLNLTGMQNVKMHSIGGSGK